MSSIVLFLEKSYTKQLIKPPKMTGSPAIKGAISYGNKGQSGTTDTHRKEARKKLRTMPNSLTGFYQDDKQSR